MTIPPPRIRYSFLQYVPEMRNNLSALPQHHFKCVQTRSLVLCKPLSLIIRSMSILLWVGMHRQVITIEHDMHCIEHHLPPHPR